ncbi:MAG: polyprenyl synthetase family protein [Pseudomonadales bacterium]|jgi:octaprenyl-diphosphate synthase|nr:polyprenyl synthetase family protein [Pseudomonadales bacterium]MDP4640939.1 polyprenyl synthetase family protein [Pseudomonadales bacterium]MDP4765479.1 polyprenyl synthetase family protein [Pseudomonadales bacterium]MDP4875164.1 polyprenyl synthetase family protein [Pseudomonadales bacterium]MDP4910819.1 polyprenyl synthetase family protein [Pseudomonadales bacterium]
MKYPFYTVVANDFTAVDQLIIGSLSSRVPLVEEISGYLIEAGGKRLRPLLVLLAANACNYKASKHINLAAIIEFLHTAMLLHDDVVDESDLRRGRKTVNAAWGNPASVLVGDFLHSRAFEMMVEIGNMRVMEILSRATNTIAEGEVQQLGNIRNPDTTEANYLQVIARKTAMLFEAASHSGAVLANASEAEEKALQGYGLHLGLAFQLIDDILDYEGTTADLGKNVGDDFAEGKVTLPLIIAMRNGDDGQRAFIRDAILSGDISEMAQLLSIVKATGGLQYTSDMARAEVDKAINCLASLPSSKYTQAMQNLAEFAVARRY